MNDSHVFEIGGLVPLEIAEVKVAVVSENEANLAETDHVVLLPLDLSMGGLNQTAGLKTSVLGVPSVQVVCLVVVD